MATGKNGKGVTQKGEKGHEGRGESVVDPYILYTDPDPALYQYTDPHPGEQIIWERIQPDPDPDASLFW